MQNNNEEHYSGISVTEIAYQKIKELIYTNEFAPGEKLNKRILAENLHLSSTPVTLALKRLWAEGLIDYRTRIGFFVKKYSYAELIEFFELRASLESMAIRLAIESNELEKFQEIIDYWNQYKGTSEDDYVTADNLFHEKIVMISNNTLIMNTWLKLGCNIKSNQRGLQNSIQESQQDHKAIIQSIQQSDATKAQLLMTDHFMKAAYHLRQKIHQDQELESAQ